MRRTERDLGARIRLPHVMAGMDPSTPVLLGFSGGADSSALLHFLAKKHRELGFPLLLCHLNHGIRGKEAERDERFCRQMAEFYGLEICVEKTDVPARVERTGESVEEAARAERYAFFGRLMRERGIPLLVTAHHADDNLETVLFRIARGTSLRGLCGISPVRRIEGGYLVRPLLELTRAQILDYCKENKIDYVTDSTNADGQYARNRLRHAVLPVLEALYAGASARAAETCAEIREDEEYLSSLARELIGRGTRDGRFSVAVLQSAPVPIRRRALTMWAEAEASLQSVHKSALLHLVEGATPSMEVSLPDDRVCRREGEYLVLGKRVREKQTQPLCIPFALGTCALGETGYTAQSTLTDRATEAHGTSVVLGVSDGCINNGLLWRTRRDGDVIFLRGMHRKLRRLQAEAGIPARLRDAIPLLCDEEGILWAPYVGVRDGASSQTGLFICLTDEGRNDFYRRNADGTEELE